MAERGQQNNNRVTSIYTLFVITLPIISVYASGITGFTIGDILLVAFFAYRFLSGINHGSLRISRRTSAIIPLIITIPILSLISAIDQYNLDIYNITVRIIRRLFYYLSVVIISDAWFDYEKGEKSLIVLGKIGAIYLFIQYTAYYVAHIVLPGFLPFFKIYHEYYSAIDYQSLFQNYFRPTSFLLEPAHISRFLVVPLAIVLFGDGTHNKWLWSFIISGAIIASTSGIGLILVVVIWFSWIMTGILGIGGRKRLPVSYLFVFIALIFLAGIALNTSVVQKTILRITNINLFDVNTASGARFRGYLQFGTLDWWHKIVGMGYGSTPNTLIVTWFTGASYMLYGTGIIGFTVCIVMFFNLFERGKSITSKVLCIIFFVLFFVDDCFMSHVSVLYFSLICIDADLLSDNKEKTVLL